MSFLEEEEKAGCREIAEIQKKYRGMKDFVVSGKKTAKNCDISDISFIFAEKILADTREHMKNLVNQRSFSENCDFLREIHAFLDNSQNVAVYGYGSKYQLLQNYAEEFLQQEPVLVFYGFFATISWKTVLSALEKTINCLKSRKKVAKTENICRNSSENLRNLEQKLEELSDLSRIVVIIHNIDGKALADAKTQEFLSELARIRKVQLLVSFDNIRYLVGLGSKILTNFDFVFVKCETFRVYEREIGMEENMISAKTEKKARGLGYILKSLSENQKDIIKIIAKFLLEHQEDDGISHRELFENCVENMVVGTETQLKENLIEIIDHDVVQQRKIEGGKTLYSMKYQINVLSKIVNNEINNESEI